jgi:hypothetical protein
VITAATGLQISDLTVFLPEVSFEAAQDDPTFIAARNNFDTDTVGEDALARYWGVGRVWTANPVTAADDGTVSALYDDIAVIYYPGSQGKYDESWGSLVWAVQFKWARWAQGMAFEAWFDRLSTSWYFPWQEYQKVGVINANCAVKLTGCAS